MTNARALALFGVAHFFVSLAFLVVSGVYAMGSMDSGFTSTHDLVIARVADLLEYPLVKLALTHASRTVGDAFWLILVLNSVFWTGVLYALILLYQRLGPTHNAKL